MYDRTENKTESTLKSGLPVDYHGLISERSACLVKWSLRAEAGVSVYPQHLHSVHQSCHTTVESASIKMLFGFTVSDITDESHYRWHDAIKPRVTLSPPGGGCRHLDCQKTGGSAFIFQRSVLELF